METERTGPQADRRPLIVTWDHFYKECRNLANRCRANGGVYGIPTGGSIVAVAVSEMLNLRPLDEPRVGCLLVDDLVDSGKTLEQYTMYGQRDALFRKPHSPKHLAPHATEWDGWIKFPWEHSGAPEDAVVRLLEFIGEDPRRDGLKDTPGRVCRALAEMTAGYKQQAAGVLGTTFDVAFDEMVVLRGIRFASLCEHHVLPFTGTVDIAYIPGGRVVGISKLARLVGVFARRLQVQERLTQEIADSILKHLKARGVGVVVRAKHHCMGCRGVTQPDAEMVTSVVAGILMERPEARAEFLHLLKA